MEPKSYGVGCVCTLWPMQPGISLVGVGICMCFPQLQVLETFKSDVYFLGIFFLHFLHSLAFPTPSFIIHQAKDDYSASPGFWERMHKEPSVRRAGRGWDSYWSSYVVTWLRGYRVTGLQEPLSEHLALPRANTFTELIPPVIIYCLHACRQSQVDHVSWIEIWAVFSLES